jgi:hypothetical protein
LELSSRQRRVLPLESELNRRPAKLFLGYFALKFSNEY